ncbi:non-ribosomal peptide synthetase [Nocardia suismassiliense]|uniref:non-ribosomal peptide synthetase n=1 Tax=Nocardia suismassiliense TaxID=2077092 RepID=UPI0018FE8349|nr:non-ribosomal peptide synthetase [Nocardia suismassiliense]
MRLIVDEYALACPSVIGERFTLLAKQHPERVAVIGDGGQLTYSELDRRSDGLARHLQDCGVRPGDIVALAARRRIATIVGLLAILKTGAGYLALDERSPRQRRELVLRRSGVRIVLVHEDSAPQLPANCRAVSLDADRSAQSPTPVTITDLHPAYLAYTSGSTGTPKGVCVPHRAVSRLVVDSDFLSVTTDDVFLQFAPIAFDASTLEIWGALLNGAQLVLAPDTELSISELTKLVGHHRVTVLWLTAGLFQQVTEGGLDELRSLRYLLAGGDVLSPAHVHRAVTTLTDTTVINGYGPTENTTFTCCYAVTATPTGPVPIGHPIRGTGVHVLDARLTLVPDDAAGELYATGTGLAHGYWDDPSLTAATFVADPAAHLPGDRMYRTGDLVRRQQSGALDYLGRIDHQVKIRGFRIEIGEVEAAIAALPGVATLAVVPQDQRGGGKRLAAWLVGESNAELSTLDVRRALAETLPSYAVPTLIRIVDALPLTANGKIDRRALAAAQPTERPQLTSAYREPCTALETAVTTLWTDYFGITGIGADDDFFELGGHSLLGVRITADLEREYGVTVSPVTFYLDPTPAGLAAAVEQGRQSA